MPPARIRVFRDRDTHDWVALHAGDPTGRASWAEAYTAADRAATSRRRLKALSDARLDLLRRLSEAHRPLYEPYPDAPGFHLARCPVCDGRKATVRLDDEAPYACRFWWDAVRVRVVKP